MLHSVAQFLKSASKDLLDGAPRISQNALEKNNSWRWWKEVWRVKLLLGRKLEEAADGFVASTNQSVRLMQRLQTSCRDRPVLLLQTDVVMLDV